MMVWRFKLSMALLTIITTGIVINAIASADELITLTTRPRVTQKILLWGQANPESLVVILIFPGGGGNIGFQEGASLEARNEYIFSDNRTLLMREGVAIAVVDAPSDNLDMSSDFRRSAIHFKDMDAVSQELKARYPKARLVLLGHSRGTVSAAYVADALGDRISAVILISGFYAPNRFRGVGLSEFDFGAIKTPMLIVHHTQDQCPTNYFESTGKVRQHLPSIVVDGPEETNFVNPCAPGTNHWLSGKEKETLNQVFNWLSDRDWVRRIP